MLLFRFLGWTGLIPAASKSYGRSNHRTKPHAPVPEGGGRFYGFQIFENQEGTGGYSPVPGFMQNSLISFSERKGKKLSFHALLLFLIISAAGSSPPVDVGRRFPPHVSQGENKKRRAGFTLHDAPKRTNTPSMRERTTKPGHFPLTILIQRSARTAVQTSPGSLHYRGSAHETNI